MAVLLLLACACLNVVLADVVVTGNPHMPPASATCPDAAVSADCARALFISPDSIIPAPAPLQADTFSHVQYVRYLDSVVPVFAAPPRPTLR